MERLGHLVSSGTSVGEGVPQLFQPLGPKLLFRARPRVKL